MPLNKINKMVEEMIIYSIPGLNEGEAFASLNDFSRLLVPILVVLSIFRVVIEWVAWRVGWCLLRINRPLMEQNQPEKAYEKMSKFTTQSWKIIYHAAATLIALWYFYDQEWWLFRGNERLAFKDFQQSEMYPIKFRWYYCIQFSFHFQSLVFHFFETRRDDHLQMVVHHIVTILLIVGSYGMGEIPIGILVFFVHDASDVTTSWAKIVNYVYAPIWIIAPSYIVLFSSWAFWRIWTFGKNIIFVLCTLHPQSTMLHGFILLLGTLWALHWYWWYQITMVGYFIIVGSEEIDCNEDRGLLKKKKSDIHEE